MRKKIPFPVAKKTCFQHLLQLTFNNFILEPLNVEAREAAETHFASHRNLNSRHILCTISQKKERMTMKEGRHEKGERERKKKNLLDPKQIRPCH